MVRRGAELSPPIGREVRRPYFVAVGRFDRQHSSLKELVGVLVAEGDRVATVERHFECHEGEPAMKAGPKAGVGAVIGAMASSEDLSTQILNNPELSQKLLGELVPIIYKALQATA